MDWHGDYPVGGVTPQEQIERDVWDLNRTVDQIAAHALIRHGLLHAEIDQIKRARDFLTGMVILLEQKDAA